jgi:toxin FitB
LILVDTNVWSELLKPQREPVVVQWLEDNSSDLYLSSIVLAELRYLVAKQGDGRRKKHASDLVTAIDAGVGRRFADFAGDDARRYGELMAARRRIGKAMPAIDGLIAAQALQRGLALATRNVSDFQDLGLTIVNPWDD